MIITYQNLGNLAEVMKMLEYSNNLSDLTSNKIRNKEVYYVAMIALKWDLLENKMFDKLEAFEDTLKSYEEGTVERKIIENHVVMCEIEKFVKIAEKPEIEAVKQEIEQVINLAKP